MNAAFYRRDAVLKLEAYATVIVEHLALITWFPQHSAASHWNTELRAFTTTLRRLNRGKKSSTNLNKDFIEAALRDEIEGNDTQDLLLVAIEGHGVKAPSQPDWNALEQVIEKFAQEIMAP